MTETEKKVREFCNENKLVFSTVGEGILALLAAEREACAKLADELAAKFAGLYIRTGVRPEDTIAHEVAAAIRARKEK